MPTVLPAALPAASDPACLRSTGTRRAMRPLLAAIALVGVVVGGCSGSTSTQTPILSPSAPASPSASAGSPAAPGSPGACDPASIIATGGPWGGAAGSRGADITVTNRGTAACDLPSSPAVAIVDPGGNVLVQSLATGASGGPVSIGPNQAATFSILFGNWCSQSVSLPLQVRLALAGGAVDIAGLAIATADALPPCNGPGQGPSLSATAWQLH